VPVGLSLIVVVRDARAAGVLREPAGGASAPAVPGPAAEDADRLMELLGPDLPAPVAAGFIAAWAQLFGLIGFEVFGRFNQLVDAREEFFDHAVTRLAAAVGLTGSEEVSWPRAAGAPAPSPGPGRDQDASADSGSSEGSWRTIRACSSRSAGPGSAPRSSRSRRRASS
jgi:hypothetical protein